ncbi:MAG: DUF6807 family protein, partial [bacterium]
PVFAPVLKLSARDSANKLNLKQSAHSISISLADKPITTYVFHDDQVKRPYFKDVFTPGGLRVTRHFPPDPKTEATDHPTMHPGVWLAFGRLNGQDYWRNKVVVLHKSVEIHNQNSPETCGFHVTNLYLKEGGSDVLLYESAHYDFSLSGGKIIWKWNSEIKSASGPILLGHQEEMGLGIRLSNDLTVKKGPAHLANSVGGIDEKGTWGKNAEWWAAYRTEQGGGLTGVMLRARSAPVLPFWGHTRDYGLIVANPTSLPNQKPDVIEIKPGESLKLQFEIILFDNDKRLLQLAK